MERIKSSDFFKNFNQPIQVEPREPQDNYPEHMHEDFSEIVIVYYGTGRHILNGYPQDLHAGVVFYVQEKDCHLYEDVKGLYLTNILIRPEHFEFLRTLQPVLEKLKPNKSSYQLISKKNLEIILKLLDGLSEYTGADDEFQKFQTEHEFMKILSNLAKNQFPVMGVGSTDERGYQILRYLAQNFLEKIDWKELAFNFSMSPRTLNKFFKEQVGVSPQNYLTKLRLHYAYEKILSSTIPITEIALDCGFCDSAYFSSCFKAEFQKTPKQLRKNKK